MREYARNPPFLFSLLVSHPYRVWNSNGSEELTTIERYSGKELKMLITIDWLKSMFACSKAIKFFDRYYKEIEAGKLLESAIQHKQEIHYQFQQDVYNWSRWLIVRVLEEREALRFAIFAADQVLRFFEDKFSGDKRPREAVEAAKICLKEITPSTLNNAKACAIAAKEAEEVEEVESLNDYYAANAARAATFAAEAACSIPFGPIYFYTFAAATSASLDKVTENTIIEYGIQLVKGCQPATNT